MIFRRAKPEDAERISQLIMGFLSELTIEPDGRGADEFLAAVSVEAERGYIRSDRYEFLLAETETKLAGFIAMRDRTHVFHLFVAPNRQRQGLAGELWRRALEAALSRGHAKEFTVNSSPNAVPVYERFGFERISDPVQEQGISFVPMRYRSGTHAGRIQP